MTEKIAIYIPDEDAKKFLLFQKNYDKFCLLLDHGFFELKNATVEVSFDKEGTLRSIKNHQQVYYNPRKDTRQ